MNVGIGGNRVLSEANAPSAATRASTRWRASTATCSAQTGVTHVIVMEGINDIRIAGHERLSPTADDLIAGTSSDDRPRPRARSEDLRSDADAV